MVGDESPVILPEVRNGAHIYVLHHLLYELMQRLVEKGLLTPEELQTVREAVVVNCLADQHDTQQWHAAVEEALDVIMGFTSFPPVIVE